MRFMTTGEVAAALHVTIPTIKRWVRDGHLTAVRTAGGHHRIPETEVSRFQEAHRVKFATDQPVRILVVDDDPHFREALIEVLGLDPRYKVELAADGYEGLIKVGTFRPHLLVLDLKMPGLDGYHVCRKVKEDPLMFDTKIIVITGYADGSARERILEAGGDGFLEKPIDLAALQSEVERVLASAPRTSPAGLSSQSAATDVEAVHEQGIAEPPAGSEEGRGLESHACPGSDAAARPSGRGGEAGKR